MDVGKMLSYRAGIHNGMDCNSFNSHVFGSFYDTAGNFTTISNQDFLKCRLIMVDGVCSVD